MLANLSAIGRGAARIVASRPGRLLRGGLLAAGAFFLVPLLGAGVPLLGLAIFDLYRTALDAPARPGRRGRVILLLSTGALFPAVGAIVAVTASSLAVPDLAALLIGAGLGLALVPMHLAAAAMLAEDCSLTDALGRVIVTTTGRAGDLVVVGAAQGAMLGLVVVAIRAGAQTLLMALLAFAVATTLAAMAHAVSTAATYETLVARQAGDFHAPRLGRVALVLAPALVALSGALGFALIVPLPAWIDRPAEELDRGVPLADGVVPEAPSGLRVRGVRDGIEVSVADGGGCGLIAGFTNLPVPIAVVPVEFRGKPAFEIGRRGFGRAAFVDEDGVRLDDTLGDRLGRRVGGRVIALLAIAGGFVALLVSMLRGASTTATLLGSRTLEAARDDATVAVVGHLRMGSDATLERLPDGTSTLVGGTTFESDDGALAVALEGGALPLGQKPGQVVGDGARAFIVAKASELRTRSHRSSRAGRALLIGLGALDDARTAFLERESQRLVWLGLPAALALLVAAATIVAAS